MSLLESILLGCETLGILALFVMTPFLVTPGTNELFEFPKMIFVYLVTAVVIASKLSRVVIRWRSNPTPHFPPRTSTTILLTVFVVLNIISTIFSPFLYTSLWGYYSRFSGGLISTFCYFSIFVILVTWKKDQFIFLLKSAVLASAVVAIYGVAQHFGLEKDRWVQDVQARVFSSFGQPNWLSAYLVLILPINLYFLIDTKKNWEKIAFWLVALLNYSALWFTFSLSGIGAFIVTIALILIIVPRSTVKRNLKFLLTLTVAWVILAVWQPGLATGRFKDALTVVKSKISVIRPALAVTNNFVVGDTADIRLIVWQGVLAAATNNPKDFLIGTGPETVAYRFWQYRPLAMNQTSEWDFLYNKSHNYFLDLLGNLGIIGLGSYLALNFVAIWQALKNRQNVLSVVIGASLIGNMITNFFGWPTVVTNLIFVLYISILGRDVTCNVSTI